MKPGILAQDGRQQGRSGARKPGDEMDVCFHKPQQSLLNLPIIGQFGNRRVKLEPPVAFMINASG
jgi:hypothetical protein